MQEEIDHQLDQEFLILRLGFVSTFLRLHDAMREYLYYKKKGNQLLGNVQYDWFFMGGL